MYRNDKARLKKAGLLLFFLIIAAAMVILGINIWKDREKKELISERGPVTIVCLGDSIWDICRDETGIAAILEKELDARVYNCAIMGTTAALVNREEEEAEWNAKSLYSIGRDVAGIEKAPLPEEDLERTQLRKIDFSGVDYFLIAYGLNDYFSAVPRNTEDKYDPYSYGGVLRSTIELLKDTYPQSRILILSQTYCQGYSYGKVDTESDWKDYGGGTGPDYVAAAKAAAEEYGVIFVDNYKDMGINIRNGAAYLSDATHLTEKGRLKYAKNLAGYLLRDYKVQK